MNRASAVTIVVRVVKYRAWSSWASRESSGTNMSHRAYPQAASSARRHSHVNQTVRGRAGGSPLLSVAGAVAGAPASCATPGGTGPAVPGGAGWWGRATGCRYWDRASGAGWAGAPADCAGAPGDCAGS